MDTTSAICTLPIRFRAGNVSAAQLVLESGLVENPKALTRVAVASFLAARPDVMESWLLWSQDKRTSSGWYLSSEGTGFVVGYYPGGPQTTFRTMIDACSEFILLEAESIAVDLRSNKSLERTRGR